VVKPQLQLFNILQGDAASESVSLLQILLLHNSTRKKKKTPKLIR